MIAGGGARGSHQPGVERLSAPRGQRLGPDLERLGDPQRNAGEVVAFAKFTFRAFVRWR
jgi:hypothetical protein